MVLSSMIVSLLSMGQVFKYSATKFLSFGFIVMVS